MVEKTSFGTMEDGREVSRYTLTNQNGVSASFRSGCNLVHDAVLDRNGEMADVLLGHGTAADWPGVTMGIWRRLLDEMANRIDGAVFDVK
ncbi:MAG: hypothetical protein ACLT76_04390 [Clostridium fessum]